jgi:hypothetical protein
MRKNKLPEINLSALNGVQGGETQYVTRDPGHPGAPAHPGYKPSWLGSFIWSPIPAREAIPARQPGCTIHANAWDGDVLRPEARPQLKNCKNAK